ncbi:MAG: type II secretion system inner membrane protein GspF [Pseudomonadota bacterium]
MPAFEYVVLDGKGRQKKGVMEGDAARQVRQSLREKGLIAISVEPTGESSSGSQTASKKSAFFSGGRVKVSVTEIALITRQLATLTQSGLPLEECLKAVAEQCEKPKVKSMMLSVRSRVVEGHTLADALSDYPQIFDRLYRAMVAAGEKAGHLDGVLERLADYTENRQAMRQKIQMAMVYPVLLIVVSILIVASLLAFVVPQIVSQFDNMGQELPGLTQLMITLSDFIRDYWWVVLGFVITFFITFNQLLKNENRLRKWHAIKLKIPMFGKVGRGLNSARFARTLSILTASGVPLLEGLKISGQVLDNIVLRDAMEEVVVAVREGSSLKRALERTGFFPPMMMHMIASGENSGELEQMLERAADNQDREFESLVTVTLGLLEPMMILLMGGMVMTIVLAILLPIFQMNDLVGR